MAVINRTFSKGGIKIDDILITGKKIKKSKGEISKITSKEELDEFKKKRKKEWGLPTVETQAKMDATIKKHKESGN